MAFRFTSNHSAAFQAPSSRSIKNPKPTRPKCTPLEFSVPKGPNWVYASGGSMPVRFDFSKALEEHIVSQDETCGSSQEYYARKAANSSTNGPGNLFIPKSSTYNPDPRFLYPTQRPVYGFNFSKATRADIDNMNTALPFSPFSPASPPERKKKTPKGLDKMSGPPRTPSFVFGRTTTSFTAPDPPAHNDKASIKPTSTTLASHSQSHEEHTRPVSAK